MPIREIFHFGCIYIYDIISLKKKQFRLVKQNSLDIFFLISHYRMILYVAKTNNKAI